jgi:uncharacterized SAM-binding protein YcdF (DUF218 family)
MNKKPFYVFLILIFNSCAFSPKMCNRLLKESEGVKYDVVVIPGVPYENGSWSPTMKERVSWSKYLYDRGIVRNVIYSGAAVYTPYYESEIMALYAEKIGIPGEHIFKETKAEHSTENIYYSYKLARNLGFKKIALASDPFQTKSLRSFVRKRISVNVGLIPVVADSLRPLEMKVGDPKIDFKKAFKPDFVSLPERENFFKRLKGTWGLDIDTTAL